MRKIGAASEHLEIGAALGDKTHMTDAVQDQVAQGTAVPFFSVITAVYNAEASIAATAASLRAQTCVDYEWIVVDGASTDSTLALVRRFLDPTRDQLLSEPDRGVYFAMNKGLRLARGEVVQFLNAGDAYAGPEVLARVRAAFDEDIDAVYGDALLTLRDGRTVLREVGDLHRQIVRRMPVTHQSFFARRALHSDHPFDETLSICADYAAVSAMYLSGARMRYLPEPLNVNQIEPHSISIRGQVRATAEYYQIQRRVHRRSWPAAAARYLRNRATIIAVNLLQRLPRGVIARLPVPLRRRIY